MAIPFFLILISAKARFLSLITLLKEINMNRFTHKIQFDGQK